MNDKRGMIAVQAKNAKLFNKYPSFFQNDKWFLLFILSVYYQNLEDNEQLWLLLCR